MELGLSLGDVSKPFVCLETNRKIKNKGLTFCMDLEDGFNGREQEEEEEEGEEEDDDDDDDDEGQGRKEGTTEGEEREERRVSADPLVQLDLLPFASFHRNSETYSGHLGTLARGFDVNRLPSAVEIDDGTAISSPNSSPSSFQIDFTINRGGCNRDSEPPGNEIETERASSRASDEEENGLIRKKLRLSKEQSAFLEESFKEHNTLNPKQKHALAKQLNLRPRQVEVWFQNRRARTKLKQTEVDCEYLKRCCETLTEENKRLQKEVQELRTLKTSNPFYAHVPATTLTMCPSCERVSTTKHRFYPFSQRHAHQSSAAS